MSAAAPKLSVVIPIYNERATIAEIIRRVQAVSIEKEILLVDDGSTDGTRDFLQALGNAAAAGQPDVALPDGGTLRTDNLRVFLQPKNRGKGAALRRGFEEARGEIVLVQDADLEYNPEEYHDLLEPIERGVADVVYGTRFRGRSQRVLFFWHYVGNRCLTTLSNAFTNLNLSDVWVCYKVFRREVLAKLQLREDGFGFEPEITAHIARNGWRVYEVPISYAGRTYAEGKKITWRDGVRALWYIVRYNLFG